MMTHFIKFRPKNGKASWFLSSDLQGDGTRLRIHASRYTESVARANLKVLSEDNPDIEFWAVPIDGKGGKIMPANT